MKQCGTPPPPGDDLSGINPPILASGATVTGATTNILQCENKQKKQRLQDEQGPTSYWSTHEGKFTLPTEMPPPGKHRNNMCPSGLAVHHPAFDTLLKYATGGCPVKTGRNWTKEEIHAAVMRGPHESALSDEAIAHFAAEAKEKVANKRARLLFYDDVKDILPEQMKVSPIAAIPHKSKAFRSILDLAFSLRLSPGTRVPSVNENSEKTAPGGAIDQIGHVLKRLIHAFAEAPDDAKIFQAKWDIKDGFWRLDCQEGEEYNVCYVLPQKPGLPIVLVVPTSLQMGWIESPPYFCAASETGRDVAKQYMRMQIGLLPAHKFQHLIEVNPEFAELPEHDLSNDPFKYMVEVYVDDFVAIAVARSRGQLRHVATSMITGIHDVFPPDKK